MTGTSNGYWAVDLAEFQDSGAFGPSSIEYGIKRIQVKMNPYVDKTGKQQSREEEDSLLFEEPAETSIEAAKSLLEFLQRRPKEEGEVIAVEENNL